MDVATVEGVEEPLDECGPLQGKGGQEEGEAHAAEAVALQEDHEEAEAHEDHGVHILEACRGEGGGIQACSGCHPSTNQPSCQRPQLSPARAALRLELSL